MSSVAHGEPEPRERVAAEQRDGEREEHREAGDDDGVPQVLDDPRLVPGERLVVAEPPAVDLVRARLRRERRHAGPHEREEEDEREAAGEDPVGRAREHAADPGARGRGARRRAGGGRGGGGGGHHFSSGARMPRTCATLVSTRAPSTMIDSAAATPRSFCPWKATL